MSFTVWNEKFDVLIAAGPRVEIWPSSGVRAISTLCAEMGLSVGVLGGDTIQPRGVIPFPGTGGIVLAEDVQKRIHRIHARSLVRVTAPSFLPDPFPGWESEGLIPLPTALRLFEESRIAWAPTTVIFGTGNRAFRFGSSLLESGASPSVICVETFAQWGAKRTSGWEVERRRFEMNGGKVIEAKPVRLTRKSALIWEVRVEDSQGVRVIETARVVSAGPFSDLSGIREYPPGSFLFELEQSARQNRSDDVEGWVLEEERGRWLAGKIIKALASDLGPNRDELERVYRRAKTRLKRGNRHQEQPFTITYQGKWVNSADSRRIRAFAGVPKREHKTRPVASIECFEEITCNLCEKACPENAIDFSKLARTKNERVLIEVDCTACGLCLSACPSSVPSLIHEREDLSISQLTLPWRGSAPWAVGEFAMLVNRRGENLSSCRVSAVTTPESGPQLVQVDVPTHLVWEARELRRNKSTAAADTSFLTAISAEVPEGKIEIILDGEKRLVREGIRLTAALFEIGQGRPQDILFCPDGSCGLCSVTVDGVRTLACQTVIRRGMVIRMDSPAPFSSDFTLCPCKNITSEHVIERLSQGKLQSPEAVLSVTHVGEGKCHGQVCGEPFRRLLRDQGMDSSQWIDWRFPWSDWVLTPGSHD